MEFTSKEIGEIRREALSTLLSKFRSALGEVECIDIVDEAWIKFQESYDKDRRGSAKNFYKKICFNIQSERHNKKQKLPISRVPTTKNEEDEVTEIEFAGNPTYSLADYPLSKVQKFLISRFSNPQNPDDKKQVSNQISKELFYYGRYLSLLGLDIITKEKKNQMPKVDLDIVKGHPEHHKYYLARHFILQK